MNEPETKQYYATVKVWVWAENETEAEDLVSNEMSFLCTADTPVMGFDVVGVTEDKEI
jgi:hypothetical protein